MLVGYVVPHTNILTFVLPIFILARYCLSVKMCKHRLQPFLSEIYRSQLESMTHVFNIQLFAPIHGTRKLNETIHLLYCIQQLHKTFFLQKLVDLQIRILIVSCCSRISIKYVLCSNFSFIDVFNFGYIVSIKWLQ